MGLQHLSGELMGNTKSQWPANEKLQIPMAKSQTMSKLRTIPKTQKLREALRVIANWRLELGISLGFGAWDLDLVAVA